MEEILTTDYAAQVVSKVNTNLDSEVISTDDTAAEAVVALNTAFDGISGAETLSANDTATDFVESLNTNCQAFEDAEDEGELGTLTFLHFSDTHGTTTASAKAKQLVADDNEGIDYVFVTGDIPAYGKNIGQTSQTLQDDFGAIGDKFLMCVGNHDVYDYYNKNGQQYATTFAKGILGNRVTWGDQSGVASYWHKDIMLSASRKLRIITLDQYELTVLNRYPGNYEYFTEYSQAQINWFMDRLTELNAGDYLIVAMHEASVQSPSVPDPYAVGLIDNNDPMKLFVSERLQEFGNRMANGSAREPQLSLFPRIMQAYLHKESLSLNYNNYGRSSSGYDITINKDFSAGHPATFLFWLCGHMHCDIVTYLPDETNLNYNGEAGDDWSDQLLLDIAAADQYVNWASEDDLGGMVNNVIPSDAPSNDYTYRINKVELDFDNKTITVTRIGACNTVGGRVRDEIEFPFVKPQNS